MKIFCKFLLLGFVLQYAAIGLGNMPQQDTRSFLKRAINFRDHSNHDSALYYYDKALQYALKSGDKLHIAYINKLKGTEFIYKGDYDTALVYLKKSRNLAKELENDTIQAISNNNIGYIMLLKGETDSAEYFFNICLRQYQSIEDTIGMARAFNLLTILYKTIGDYDKGLEAALKSTYYFKKFNQTQKYIRSLLNLGNIYEKLGENDTAYSCYETCYNLSLENNNSAQAYSAMMNMSVIDFNYGIELKEKGDTARAMEMYQKSNQKYTRLIEVSKQNNDKKTLALCYSNVSNLQREFEQYNDAVFSSKQALELAREFGDVGNEIYALRNLGLSYLAMEKYEKARKTFLTCLELSRKAKYKEDQGNVLSSLSVIYELQGDYKTALYYNREASVMRDSILNEVKQKEIEKHKTNFEILHLKDQNRIKELDKKRIRAERNTTLGIGISLVVLLLVILILFRMRARKNRIIARQKIQKLEDEKKLMAARSVLVGQEKERERIARELHDGIGVLLSTASIHFSTVEESADEKTKEMFTKANKLLKDAGKEVREISHNMMPGVLSKFGLSEAIEDLFEEIMETGDLKVNLNLTCGDDRLPENMEIMLYRVIQEMLNNTIKHANAESISLNISRNNEIIYIDYKDDGVGFDEDKLPLGKNLGLSGIRSRIEYLGGSIELISSPGKGTRYSIEIPLSEKLG